MADYTQCTLCHAPQSIDQTSDKASIYSNVREFRKEVFTVWRCESCRSLHSKEDADLNRYYAKYPVQNHKLDFPTRCAYANRLSLLKKWGVNKNQSILDFGCGPGLFVSYLSQKGFRISGYDLYERGFTDKSLLTKKYDVVLSYDVIEHDKDPREYMDQIVPTVRDGGMLGIGTPNATFINLNQPQKYFMELHQPYHQHLLSESALLSLAKPYRLEPIKIVRKFYFDTPIPMINTRFIERYVHSLGNVIDVLFEELHPMKVLTSPSLLFWGLFGYYLPTNGNMIVFFRKN